MDQAGWGVVTDRTWMMEPGDMNMILALEHGMMERGGVVNI